MYIYIHTFCLEHVLKLPETCSQTFGYSHLACKATWHTAQHKVACTYGTYSMCTELALLLWQLYEKMVRLRPIIDVDPKTRLRITHLLSKVRPTPVLPSPELLDLDTFKTRVPIAINCVRIVRLQQSHTHSLLSASMGTHTIQHTTCSSSCCSCSAKASFAPALQAEVHFFNCATYSSGDPILQKAQDLRGRC